MVGIGDDVHGIQAACLEEGRRHLDRGPADPELLVGNVEVADRPLRVGHAARGRLADHHRDIARARQPGEPQPQPGQPSILGVEEGLSDARAGDRVIDRDGRPVGFVHIVAPILAHPDEMEEQAEETKPAGIRHLEGLVANAQRARRRIVLTGPEPGRVRAHGERIAVADALAAHRELLQLDGLIAVLGERGLGDIVADGEPPGIIPCRQDQPIRQLDVGIERIEDRELALGLVLGSETDALLDLGEELQVGGVAVRGIDEAIGPVLGIIGRQTDQLLQAREVGGHL